MDKFFEIVEYTRKTNEHYNTSGFSFYLYGLIKMIKPLTVVELGTGVGTTCFMAAQACKENNKGRVITIDSGQDYQHSNFSIDTDFKNYSKNFDLEKFLELRKDTIDLKDLKALNDIDNIDILFNDIDCGPHYFLTILSWLLPRVKNECYFIIDQGATYWPNYCAVELTLPQLNQGKVPDILLDIVDDPLHFKELINKFKFSVQYILKAEEADNIQDSFAVIKIETNNIGYRMI